MPGSDELQPAGGEAGFGRRLPSMSAVPGLAKPEPAATDVGLGTVSMPSATMRRIVRSAAPGVRFNGEAIAALHRVAQAFVCYATDRCIQELRGDTVLAAPAAQKKKQVKVGGPTSVKKTLGVDHVMKVLSKEVPPVAAKISNLFPELVPPEYRPQEIKLLEQLREQRRAAALGKSSVGFASGQDDDPAFGPAADVASGETSVKRPAEGNVDEPPKKKPAGASLSGMFGRQKAAMET
jgi:histone H3/H4